MSTWLAGRNTATPMSTSRPPLIFRVATPVTTSFSCTVSMTCIQASIFSAFRLLRVIMPRRVVHQALDVLDVLDQDLDHLSRLGQRLALFPFAAKDDAFALVSHVDQHVVAFGPQHAAVDDLVDRHFLGAPLDFLGRGRLHGGGEFLLPLLVAEVQAADKVAIDHRLDFRSEKNTRYTVGRRK